MSSIDTILVMVFCQFLKKCENQTFFMKTKKNLTKRKQRNFNIL